VQCTAADLGWLAKANDRQSYQRISQKSECVSSLEAGSWR